MYTNFDTNWDIEKYRSPFESEEHWELRKNFLTNHKDKYPEDKLICLAQVFINVELLGCKYPDETMALVSELSERIADDYREKKQQKLQRTFVNASDAACAKIKGLSSAEGVPNVSKRNLPTSAVTDSPGIGNCSLTTERENVIFTATADLINTREVNSLLKDLVILKAPNENFFNQGTCIVQRSFARKNLTPEYRIMNLSENKNKIVWECVLSVSGFNLARATATSKQTSKKAATESFLNSLREICYIIEEKTCFISDGSAIDKNCDNVGSEELKLSDGSIGCKMMKLMGWKGGGLGKSEDGIAEPVTVQDRIYRSGFGSNLPKSEIMDRLSQRLAHYARKESNHDLVFSSDFSKDERAKLHSLAQKYHLTSRSYGSGSDRHLVVSKRVKNLMSLVTTLLSCGGENDRYKLIPPLNTLYE